MTVQTIYDLLYTTYGPQGWWPLLAHDGTNPTKTGSIHGYHPGDYTFPKNEQQRFEICVGSILTQNTNWKNVEKAIIALEKKKLLAAPALAAAKLSTIRAAIRPAGYYNQKSTYLKAFTAFFLRLQGKTPSREELLGIHGVGPETADTMLLYAWHVPIFVVDAYTKRICAHLQLCQSSATYAHVQAVFMQALPKDHIIMQEYHALLVEHAKHQYTKKPYGQGCVLHERIVQKQSPTK